WSPLPTAPAARWIAAAQSLVSFGFLPFAAFPAALPAAPTKPRRQRVVAGASPIATELLPLCPSRRQLNKRHPCLLAGPLAPRQGPCQAARRQRGGASVSL